MNDARNKEVKVGDFVLGKNTIGSLVVGPVVFVDEKNKGVVVGEYRPNGALVTEFELVESVKIGGERVTTTSKPTPVPLTTIKPKSAVQ